MFVVLSYPCCFFITAPESRFICDLIIASNPFISFYCFTVFIYAITKAENIVDIFSCGEGYREKATKLNKQFDAANKEFLQLSVDIHFVVNSPIKLYRVERIFYTNFACPMCALLRILIERSRKFSARRIQMLSTQYHGEIILTYNLFIVYCICYVKSPKYYNPQIGIGIFVSSANDKTIFYTMTKILQLFNNYCTHRGMFNGF